MSPMTGTARFPLLAALVLPLLIACDAGDIDSEPQASIDGGTIASTDAAPANDAMREPCQPLANQNFPLLSSDGAASDRPAAEHGDLNLKLRSWSPVQAEPALVDINGATDALAPKLNTIFADERIPTITATYAVNHWDWAQNQRAGQIDEPVTTLVGFATSENEAIALARSGYDIGDGMQGRVLYMDEDSITFGYTRSDSVASGYALHVAGICPDPELLRLYQENNASGRALLPAVAGAQAFGRARGTEVMVSIRDTGAFMDPRSRKDWW